MKRSANADRRPNDVKAPNASDFLVAVRPLPNPPHDVQGAETAMHTLRAQSRLLPILRQTERHILSG